MRIDGWLIGLGLAAALTGSARAAPLEEYGRLPNIEHIALSPNGALLAESVTTDGRTHSVVIFDLAAHKVIGGFNPGEIKLRSIQWAGDNHLLATYSRTGVPMGFSMARGEWSLFTDYDVATKRQTQPMADMASADQTRTNTTEVYNVVQGRPMVRIIGGKPYAFVMGLHVDDGYGVPSLFKVDLDADHVTLAAEADVHTDDWLVDQEGRPIGQAEFDGDKKLWTLRVMTGGVWRTAKTVPADLESPDLIGFGHDGRSLLIVNPENHVRVVHEFAQGAADWGPAVAEDVDEFITDPATHAFVGYYRLMGDEDRYVFFDPGDQAIWAETTRAFPGARVSLKSWSADHKKLVVLVEAPDDSPAYALVDVSTGHAEWIGQPYAALRPEDVSPKTAIRFKAADGLELTGYLTLPRGRDPKGLPLVVLPHGGPQARDDPAYDWLSQGIASLGYAVLQVNYRGSDGFGWDFISAGFGQWGRKMQTDLSDGVRYLAAQGTIDPKRVCIVGASYGGYAALAGATLDRGVYRCAVSDAGPSDLPSMVAWSKDKSGDVTERYWKRFMGGDGVANPHLEDVSPTDHVDGLKIPILLIHGKDDTVVPFEQSVMMQQALQRAGDPPEFVVLNHEDHWLSSGDTRLQFLQAIADFLKKYNPPT